MYPLLTFIKYCSKIARQYIRNYKYIEKKDFTIDIFSAQIDSGLWDKPRYNPAQFVLDKKIENERIDNVNARFIHNEANIMEIFNFDLITSIFKDQLKRLPCVIEYLDEVYICTISILLI